MQVILNLSDLDRCEQKLKAINSIINTAPLMQEIANYLYNIAKDSFDYEQAPNGTPWQELSSSTLKAKATSKILYNSGSMQNALTFRSTNNSAIVELSITNNKGFPYACIHQFGASNIGKNKNIKIPARPFLPIDKKGVIYKDVKDEILNIAVDFIKNALK